jgi:hypothetical protein
MIPVHSYDADGTCQHCSKKRYGTFGVTINHKSLRLCFKCLANQVGIFADEPKTERPTVTIDGRT